MSRVTTTFVDGVTVITADHMNGIVADINDLESGKVNKQTGKGLSTNDYTDAEKAKLAGIDLSGYATKTELDEQIDDVDAELDDLKSALDTKAPAIYKTAGPAAVVTVTDGADGMPVKALTVQIDPIQDLHGYDSPWPPGGGVNQFNNDNSGITYSYMSQSNGTFTNTNVDTKNFFSFIGIVLNGSTIVAHSSSVNISATGRYSVTINITGECTRIQFKHNGSTRDLSFYYPWTTQGIVTLSFDVVGYDVQTVGGLILKNIVIALGDIGSAYFPYSNICPISGRTGANLHKYGLNLADFKNAVKWTTATGYDVEIVENGVHVYTTTPGTYRAAWIKVPPLVIGKRYVLQATCLSSDGTAFIAFRRKSATSSAIIKSSSRSVVGTPTKLAVEWTATVENPQISLFCTGSSSEAGDAMFSDIILTQIDSGSPVYETYNDDSEEIQLGWESAAGTVYGGTAVYNGDGTWTLTVIPGYIASYNGEPLLGDYISSEAAPNSIPVTGSQVFDFGAAPLTYTLTSEELITTLKGDNNIWSDAGDVTAEYPADTKLYIDSRTRATRSMIAGIETGMTASRAYSVGELLIVGDALYRVVAAIASGATLTPGTNVTATTVAEQLLLLANL